jgi:hypothetical protein
MTFKHLLIATVDTGPIGAWGYGPREPEPISPGGRLAAICGTCALYSTE